MQEDKEAYYKMAKKQISEAEAIQLMFQFVTENLKAVEDLRHEDNDFLAKKDGIEVVLRTTATPLKPAKSYTTDVRANFSGKLFI